MHSTALIIFVLTYAGIALGEIPGLALDRTGIALLGALAMVGCGVLSEAEAFSALDMPTLLLLYALMVVSAQFRLGGFYTRIAMAITRSVDRPRRFLFQMMLVSACLSALLANDIVCLAFTPVLCVAILRARRNPAPFLVGLACASNIGSAATIIGNPQNMLIGQVGHLQFGRFVAWCAIPTVFSLLAAYGIIAKLGLSRSAPEAALPAAPDEAWPAYDAHQSRKGIWITGALVLLFFTPIPREISALAAAGVLLCSRRLSTRSILGLVDWHLITLFCGLFIVVRGIELSHLPAAAVDWLSARGWNLANPHMLTGISVALSNLVSNVPATMLLIKFLDPARPEPWYVLALSSTYAGNLITIGSIANLITIEQAGVYGVRISFREHARLGVPVTLASLAILAGWILLAG